MSYHQHQFRHTNTLTTWTVPIWLFHHHHHLHQNHLTRIRCLNGHCFLVKISVLLEVQLHPSIQAMVQILQLQIILLMFMATSFNSTILKSNTIKHNSNNQQLLSFESGMTRTPHDQQRLYKTNLGHDDTHGTKRGWHQVLMSSITEFFKNIRVESRSFHGHCPTQVLARNKPLAKEVVSFRSPKSHRPHSPSQSK